MTAQDYAEWCRLSGLYLANYSHLERYQTYAKVISPAGLTVAIVSEFLEGANATLDPNDWRTNSVYELGPQQTERLKFTVAALTEIGAPVLAQAVTASQSRSPFDAVQGILSGGVPDFAALSKAVNPLELLQSLQGRLSGNRGASPEPDTLPDATAPKRETRPRVEALLEQFAQAHAAELRQDIDRHGDPRRAPGYTLQGRLSELNALQKRWASHRVQRDDIESIAKVMDKIPKLLAQNTEGKEKKAASHLKQLVRAFQEKVRDLRKIAVDDRCPEWAAFLPKVEAFEAGQAALVRPDVFGDAALKQAAEAIGSVETKTNRKSTELSWDHARGIECDWTKFSLTLSVPAKSPDAMQRALRAIERLRQQFPELQRQWRAQALESFREIYQGQMSDEELEEFEVDEQGELTDAAILGQVDSGSIHLAAVDADASDFTLSAFLDVEWEPEHGLELVGDVDLRQAEPLAAESAQEPLNLHGLTFDQPGSPLTAGDLDRFEATWKVKLPSDYRELLLASNGGVPARTQLLISMHGDEQLWTVRRFLSLSGATEPPFPDDSLEGALRLPNGAAIQSHLLPIAWVRQGTFPPRPIGNPLLAIVLKGKRAGRIIFFEADGMLPPAEDVATAKLLHAALDEAVRSPLTAAPTLSKLCKNLQPAAPVTVPDWLRFIRENQVDAFLAWLKNGGSLKTQYIDPSEPFRPRVVDLVTAEAAPELLQALVSANRLTPRHLLESWQTYSPADIARFEQLMPFLPQSDWSAILTSPAVWDHPTAWEKLAAAGIDLNQQFQHERRTPVQLAVLAGRPEAVRWLLAHGADPRKQDRFRQDAFALATTALGRSCQPVLQTYSAPVGSESTLPDVPGLAELTAAVKNLPAGTTLRLLVEMTSPPVTRLEQAYYAQVGCHYRLMLEVGSAQVTFNDTRSPRQDYLHAPNWPDSLFMPIVQWPELTPMWETLQVQEFELAKALKSRKYTPAPRADLVAAARSALEHAFNPQAAAARGVEL